MLLQTLNSFALGCTAFFKLLAQIVQQRHEVPVMGTQVILECIALIVLLQGVANPGEVLCGSSYIFCQFFYACILLVSFGCSLAF